jgi:hypothetical protein
MAFRESPDIDHPWLAGSSRRHVPSFDLAVKADNRRQAMRQPTIISVHFWFSQSDLVV